MYLNILTDQRDKKYVIMSIDAEKVFNKFNIYV